MRTSIRFSWLPIKKILAIPFLQIENRKGGKKQCTTPTQTINFHYRISIGTLTRNKFRFLYFSNFFLFEKLLFGSLLDDFGMYSE